MDKGNALDTILVAVILICAAVLTAALKRMWA
jgi:hypothetical protein